MSDNLTAFLKMIQTSEGTAKCPNPYAVTFGYQFTITDFSDHPALLGWTGYPLTSLGARYADEVSTAAGAYQLIKPTWMICKQTLRLPDFTAPSQDAAATLLIRQKGALAMVENGEIAAAIGQCKNVWASLPGNLSGQPQKRLADLLDTYTQHGGGFA